MLNLLDLTFNEIKSRFIDEGLPSFRSDQIINWIYKKFTYNFESMSDIPAILRPELSSRYNIINLSLLDSISSKNGDTIKFLFETADKNLIEAVLILADDDIDEPDSSRMTLCVSSQAGCPIGCRFCATGFLGFKRNLTAGEIISEVLITEQFIQNIDKNQFKISGRSHDKITRKISNIVFMGMGEPLLNYENVLKSIEILNFTGGYNLGNRHFTISTAGIIPGIELLKKEALQLRLAVSLHSAFQSKRETLMPLAVTYNLKNLILSLKDYQTVTERRITFEYVLIEGENDSEKDAAELKHLLNGLDYNLNVIEYNPVEEISFRPPSESGIRQFKNFLKKYNIPYVFRKSKGRGIKAGCGQLGLYWKNRHQAS